MVTNVIKDGVFETLMLGALIPLAWIFYLPTRSIDEGCGQGYAGPSWAGEMGTCFALLCMAHILRQHH